MQGIYLYPSSHLKTLESSWLQGFPFVQERFDDAFLDTDSESYR